VPRETVTRSRIDRFDIDEGVRHGR
jgi:hypothetical protein